MKVVHCKRDRFDLYIGRPSKWGNPFAIGRDGNRDQVIAKYRSWVVSQKHLMNSLSELEGKVLGCWCAPKPCHGDVLIELVEERRQARAKSDRHFIRSTISAHPHIISMVIMAIFAIIFTPCVPGTKPFAVLAFAAVSASAAIAVMIVLWMFVCAILRRFPSLRLRLVYLVLRFRLRLVVFRVAWRFRLPIIPNKAIYGTIAVSVAAVGYFGYGLWSLLAHS